MKRNESKSVVSLVAAAVFAVLAVGCASVPGGELFAEESGYAMPVDGGTGTE